MSEANRDPVEHLAEEFLERYRRGERPALTEYTGKFPDLAAKIRELFPALVLLEEVGPQDVEAAEPGAGVTAGGQAPEQLGDYRLLRPVGRGGMGVVYEAVQESLGRHVALKVLPYPLSRDATYLKRFRREARSAARLHHTNIVPVFDVGQCHGIHYYAMQFIQGQGLDEVLEELRRLRASARGAVPEAVRGANTDGPPHPGEPTVLLVPNLSRSLAESLFSGQFIVEKREAGNGKGPDENPPSLSGDDRGKAVREVPSSSPVEPVAEEGREAGPSALNPGSGFSSAELSARPIFQFYRSVARVGLQVAEALAYAHGQKVLHRDIKPSNLLLDQQGTVWVTDFGLAKAEEGEDLTQTGDIVGTLRYMAPERFQGQSDGRSDVYSLGATLYELLTLRPAFEDTNRARFMERVAREEPAPLRKLDPHIPRDLETIILKAMAKEPARRYQEAAHLADDLRRFLADRPIRARRPPLLERSWRWYRRNRVVATLAATLLVVLSGGLAGVAWQWQRAETNFRAAKEKGDIARAQRFRADENARKARQAFDEAFIWVSESKLIDVPGAQPLRRELLQKALSYYQDFLNQGNDDPEARADQAAAYFRVGTILISQEQDEEAFASFNKGLDLVEQLLHERPDDPELPKHLAGCLHVSPRLHSQGDFMSHPPKDARTVLRMLRIWEEFARAYPAPSGFRRDLALLYYLEAEIHEHCNRPDEALSAYRKTRALGETLSRQEPTARLVDELLKRTYSQLRSLLESARRPQEAEAVYRDAVAFYEQQATLHPGLADQAYNLADMLTDLSDFLRKTGRGSEAQEALARSIALLEKGSATHPGNPDYQSLLADSYWKQAILLGEGRAQEVERSYRRGAAIAERLLANFPDAPVHQQQWAGISLSLGYHLARTNRIPEGEELIRQVREIRKNLVAHFPSYYHYHYGLWQSYRCLALVLAATGRIQQAGNVFREAQQHFEKVTTEHLEESGYWACLADVSRTRAQCLAAANQPRKAGEVMQQCLAVIERHALAGHSLLRGDLPWTTAYLVQLLNQAEKHAGAEAVERQVIDLYAKLAVLDPAEPWWRKCELAARARLARWLVARARTREAEEIFRQATSEKRTVPFFGSVALELRADQAELWFNYGKMLERVYRFGEATEAFRRATALFEALAKDFPKERAWRQQLAFVQRELGHVLKAKGQVVDAEKAYRQSQELLEQLAGEYPDDFWLQDESAHGLRWLSFLLFSERPEEAEKSLRKALRVFEARARRDRKDPWYLDLVADTEGWRGHVFAAMRQPRDAEEAYRRALRLFEQQPASMLLHGYFPRDWRKCVVNLVNFLRSSGRRQEAEEAERQAWARLDERFTALVRQWPNDASAWLARGQWYAFREKWQQAADDVAKAIDLNPKIVDFWVDYASLLVLAGRAEEYRQFCAPRLDELGPLENQAAGPWKAYEVSRMCSLAEGAVAVRPRVVRAAEYVMAADPAPWSRHLLALAYYRAGRSEAAMEWAQRSLEDPTGWGKPMNWLILALACHRLGRADDARQWLDQAVRAWPDDTQANALHFQDWLEGQVLLREAVALIRGDNSKK